MKRKAIFLLLIILIIAVFFRFWKISQIPPGLYPDEAMNGNNALEAIKNGNFKIFYPENNGREGLFINIQAIFLKFLMPLFNGDPKPWMLRIVSALFGLLTVLGVYLLAKELFGQNPQSESLNSEQTKNSNPNSKQFGIWSFKKWDLFRNSGLEIRISRSSAIALLSSFFIAVSFWHINFSRIGFRAILVPFFLVWSFWLVIRAFNQKNIWLGILAGLFFGLGFHTYIAYRFSPLIALVPIIYYFKN